LNTVQVFSCPKCWSLQIHVFDIIRPFCVAVQNESLLYAIFAELAQVRDYSCSVAQKIRNVNSF
jgi:hypothetical protein